MKKECDINAFTCYIPSRSIKWNVLHPIKYIKAICRGFRAAWQRATKGFCDYDLWDLDSWLLKLLPSALENFVKNNNGYPFDFKTIEEWNDFLLKMATDFRACQDPEAEDRNEYYEEYIKQFEEKDGWHRERTEIDKKYFTRSRELYEEQQRNLEEVFARLAKWLRAIWW